MNDERGTGPDRQHDGAALDDDERPLGPPPAPPPDPLRPVTDPSPAVAGRSGQSASSASAAPPLPPPPHPVVVPQPGPPSTAAPPQVPPGRPPAPLAGPQPSWNHSPDGPGPQAPGGVWQPQTLIPEPQPVPKKGWRRAVYRASLGRANPGLSSPEQKRVDLRRAITKPLAGRVGERIAVVSTKGGVGKTTTTLMLGHTLAAERGDRVIALDANPDYGTLGYRVAPDSQRTVRDLLDGLDSIHSYPDVRAYTTQADSRLEVLAGDADPLVSEAFTADDYRRVMATLGRQYNVALTDCGTGVLHDAMSAVLALATQLVIVTGPAVDQARHADHLIRWLHGHGAGHLVARSVVVVNASRNDLAVDKGALIGHFAALVTQVVEIPYDPVLAAGGIDGLDRLARETGDAYLTLAAAVAAGFGQALRPAPN